MSYKQKLLDKIAARTARIGVIGLGYVGLPLAVEFARAGLHTIGFEVDARKAEAINRGESYIIDVPSSAVAELVAADSLQATTDFSALADVDVIIICVPTPLRKTKEPDVSYILAAAEKIQETLRPGQLVILESTTYPGTTDEVLRPMFDAKGLILDEDYFLAFSPERIDPGNERFNTKNIPKVVGGISPGSTEVAAATYEVIVDKVHRVSSARVAEACKLLENTFRAVNIGLVNELSQLCYTLGIDTWEVIGAAATKPFGFMAFYPGPGIGGHCLVGDEVVVVRTSDGSGQRLTSLTTVFAEQQRDSNAQHFSVDGGGDVICRPRIEALSIDPLTKRPSWRPVSYLFRRSYEGDLVTITTSDNRCLTVTDEHPMLVCDEAGNLRQVFAKDLRAGDRLPIHSPAVPVSGPRVEDAELRLLPLMPPSLASRVRVRIACGSWVEHRATLQGQVNADELQEFLRQDYLPLDTYLALERAGAISLPHESLRLYTGRGPSVTSFPAVVKITPAFARLVGYFLAEGCRTREGGRGRLRLSFHCDETEFIDDVRSILETELGVRCSVIHSRVDQVTHLRVASSLFGWLLGDVLKCGHSSATMRVPDILMDASPIHHRELLKGLLRSDGDVYVKTGARSYCKKGRDYVVSSAAAEVGFLSSSPHLFQQAIYLLQNLGFRPTFKRVKPYLGLKGHSQLSAVRDWLGPKTARLEEYFEASHSDSAGHIFKNSGALVTVPVKSVEIKPAGQPIDVYSIEVEGTHTFTTSYGIYVHNCIPLDPHYLSWKARMHGFEARFISLAEEVNSRMPEHVVALVQDGLNQQRKAVNGSRILVLGVAYKRDIDDMRESPALAIIEKLQKLGGEVVYHDPYVPQLRLDGGEKMRSVELNEAAVAEADCVVIVTDHRNVNYRWVAAHAKLVVDSRNATKELRGSEFEAKILRL